MHIGDLRGIAVVSLAEGAKLGQVDVPLFDPATLHLRAFRVRGDRQTFIVPLDLVRTIGADAIMVESSAATQADAKGGAYGDLVEFATLKHLKVVDAAGTFVGTVNDLELDPATGRALRIVAHKGGVLGLGGETTMVEMAAIHTIGAAMITLAAAGVPPPA